MNLCCDITKAVKKLGKLGAKDMFVLVDKNLLPGEENIIEDGY